MSNVLSSLFCACTVGLTGAVHNMNQVLLLNGAQLGQRFHAGTLAILIVLCLIIYTAFSQASRDLKAAREKIWGFQNGRWASSFWKSSEHWK